MNIWLLFLMDGLGLGLLNYFLVLGLDVRFGGVWNCLYVIPFSVNAPGCHSDGDCLRTCSFAMLC